jgi:hypothetical protein
MRENPSHSLRNKLLGSSATYKISVTDSRFRQGEILSGVNQYIVTPTSPTDGAAGVVTTVVSKRHPFAVIITQDCDLAQDFTGRCSVEEKLQKLKIPNVLLCEVDLADNMRGNGVVPQGSEIWKNVTQNKNERFEFLRSLPSEDDLSGEGLAPLLCDFKKVFSVPTDVLYLQAKGVATRRAYLLTPYAEHLSTRYAYFLSRIGLPLDHHDPVAQSPA